MFVQQQRYSFEEFEQFQALPQNRGRLFELIDGEVVEKVPTQAHGIVAVNISTPLKLRVMQGFPGRVAVEVRHKMPHDPHNALLPDVSFYIDITLPVITSGAVPRMPDLAVEIQSPDDSLRQLRERAQYYLANGSRMVWLVLIEKRLVLVMTADDEYILTEGDILEGGDVLPGFTLPVRDIFVM